MNKYIAKNCYDCENFKNCSKCKVPEEINEKTRSLAVKTITSDTPAFQNVIIDDTDNRALYAIPIRRKKDILSEDNLESMIKKMGYVWRRKDLSASTSVVSESLLSASQFSGTYDILIRSAGKYIKKYASDLIIDIHSLETKIDNMKIASQCYYFGIRDYGCDSVSYMANRTSDFFDKLLDGEETSEFIYCSKKNVSGVEPVYRNIFKLEIEVCFVKEGRAEIMHTNSTLYELGKKKTKIK